jgi:hypothetical protein
MKIISFSLWGNKPMYTVGAVENIKLSKIIYPDWTCRFYVDNTVPQECKINIKENGGEIVEINYGNGAFWGMFWRFMAIDDINCEAMISRDCDSRLSFKEKAAVDEWLNSDMLFHTMHDHPHHAPEPILGGMWGAKKASVVNISEKIQKWGQYHRKSIDQDFLRYMIWDSVKDKTLSHSSIHNRWHSYIPFPKHEGMPFGGLFVGQVFDENNVGQIPR